jgi:uncharacterized protein YigA (DUF484 family)
MTAASLSADTIAHFLQENPSFFQDHAEFFANLRVPHPNETRAISLGERQILTLRARVKDLEWKLSGLAHNASGNEKTSKTLTHWCCRMLAEDDATVLPHYIVTHLREFFDLPGVALRAWDLAGLDDDSPYLQDVTPAIREYARELSKPYCGPYKNQEAASLLDATPSSIAAIALRPEPDASPLGLLVLGSDDLERFTSDMGTTFLEIIGDLAGAALSRLQEQAEDDRA